MSTSWIKHLSLRWHNIINPDACTALFIVFMSANTDPHPSAVLLPSLICLSNRKWKRYTNAATADSFGITLSMCFFSKETLDVSGGEGCFQIINCTYLFFKCTYLNKKKKAMTLLYIVILQEFNKVNMYIYWWFCQLTCCHDNFFSSQKKFCPLKISSARMR